MGKWRCSSTILDIGTRWGWLVNFTTQPLYPRGKSPRSPLEISTGGWWAAEPAWALWNREKSLAPAGNRTPAIQSVASRYPYWSVPARTLIGVHIFPKCLFSISYTSYALKFSYCRLGFTDTKLSHYRYFSARIRSSFSCTSPNIRQINKKYFLQVRNIDDLSLLTFNGLDSSIDTWVG
jgi:hypothetical protein